MSFSSIRTAAVNVFATSPNLRGTIRVRAPRVAAVLALTALLALAGCGGDDDTEVQLTPEEKAALAATEPTGATNEPDNYGYPADEPRKNSQGELLPPPVQIYGADNSSKRVDKDTVEIITSQKEFEQLQKDLFKGQDERALPGTNFKTRQMIVVFLEPRNDGASTQITTVRKRSNGFTVAAFRLMPGKGCEIAEKDTTPYSIVETDKLKGDAKLKVTDQARPDC